jgi:membrane protease YdiL (CAAX protease family)
MNTIIRYIKDFFGKEFSWLYFFVILIMVGWIIYFNYWQGLEKKYVAAGTSWLRHFAGYYLLYFIPFALAFFLQPLFFKNCSYLSNGWFWAILVLAPAFFSFRVNFNFHQQLIYKNWQGTDLKFYFTSINWIIRVIVVLVPVFIIWWLKDKGNQPFYGTRSLDTIKPYLIMLLIMVPLIALASTQTDFLKTYPKAQVINAISATNWQGKLKYFIYELCYGFDFVSIEFFFRGFLILSLLHICGTQCIIPVACFYCTIHLGKPMGEAISSLFGGMILGIVSYNTGSIWGGLIVHLGIAWMMEAGGWLGHLFRRV